jgi:hypothetical protein
VCGSTGSPQPRKPLGSRGCGKGSCETVHDRLDCRTELLLPRPLVAAATLLVPGLAARTRNVAPQTKPIDEPADPNPLAIDWVWMLFALGLGLLGLFLMSW